MKAKRKSRTELQHKLLWYVENYGLSLNTVRRHRELLDRPLMLLYELLSSRGVTANVQKLLDYVNAHPELA